MKLWVDDVRPAPDGYYWCKSVYETIDFIESVNLYYWLDCPIKTIELIDLDHDAGNYSKDGGDYINILNFLESMGDGYPIPKTFHIHSMNPVGVQNMRAIIEKNGWKEI